MNTMSFSSRSRGPWGAMSPGPIFHLSRMKICTKQELWPPTPDIGPWLKILHLGPPISILDLLLSLDAPYFQKLVIYFNICYMPSTIMYQIFFTSVVFEVAGVFIPSNKPTTSTIATAPLLTCFVGCWRVTV